MEIEILRSMTNAEQVAQLLHLNWQIENTTKGLTFTLAEFEAPNSSVPYTVELTAPDQYVVKDNNGAPVGAGRNNVPLQQGKFRLLLSDIKGKKGDSFQVTLQPLDAIVDGIVGSIRAGELGTNTGIIRLSVRNASPARARAIANTLAQVYAEQNIAFKSEEASKTLQFIEEQMKRTHTDVADAESRVQQYKSSAKIYDLQTEVSQLVSQLSDIDKQKAALAFQKKLIEFSLSSLKDAMARGQVFLPSVMKDDPAIGTLSDKVTELEIQKKVLRLEKAEHHPAVRAIQTQIDETLQKLRGSYETTLRSLTRQEQELGKQVPKLEGDLKKFPEVELQLANLTRVAKVNVDIYLYLMQKHEEARIAKAATVSNVSIIDSAKLPRAPVYPNKQKNIVIGLLLGLLLGGGLAFFVDYLDDTIKNGEEARHKLGLPVLATIPFIKLDGAPDDDSPAIITHRTPKAATSEAFRSLRTSVHFSAISTAKKIILVTSSFPGEGKTTIISNLAVTLSQTGARVLLIDCDMRRPSLHKLFKRDKVPGLSELLAGDTSPDAVIRESGIQGLDFIAAGTSPPNPAELLGSKQFQELLETFKLRYDNVLLDAPPFLAVTDAPLLTESSDIMILVLETERVPAKTALRTVEMLDMVHAPVAGIVLNDKTGQAERYGYYGSKYYGSSYYGYGYYRQTYYGEEDKTKTKKEAKKWWKRLLRKA
jgi:tyrosine-protein kinase Etk/Wzc